MDTKALRAAVRAKRSRLDPASIISLSIDISAHLWRLPLMARSRRIAFYMPMNGEVDCRFAARSAWERGRKAFLPVIRGPELVFAPYRPDSKFLRNRYGIPEPIAANGPLFRPGQIDVVLTPLVVFDEEGNRIGMGAGYYDRSFEFMRRRRHWNRPHLVGLAYDFQKTLQIKACSWDVPLQFVVTEKNIYSF